MTIKDLKTILANYSDDTQIVVSSAEWLDKKNYIYAIIDNPITGLSYCEEEIKELRLFTQTNVKKQFPDISMD